MTEEAYRKLITEFNHVHSYLNKIGEYDLAWALQQAFAVVSKDYNERARSEST